MIAASQRLGYSLDYYNNGIGPTGTGIFRKALICLRDDKSMTLFAGQLRLNREGAPIDLMGQCE